MSDDRGAGSISGTERLSEAAGLGRRRERLADEGDDQDRDERGEVDEAGARHELADRRDERFRNRVKRLGDRILHAPVEPRHDRPADDSQPEN